MVENRFDVDTTIVFIIICSYALRGIIDSYTDKVSAFWKEKLAFVVCRARTSQSFILLFNIEDNLDWKQFCLIQFCLIGIIFHIRQPGIKFDS